MSLTTPSFKFLDVKNYLNPGIDYISCCKALRCEVSKFIFPYEWLNDYNKLQHVGSVHVKNKTYSILRGGFKITLSLFKNVTPEVV